jgi:hypothetical protein
MRRELSPRMSNTTYQQFLDGLLEQFSPKDQSRGELNARAELADFKGDASRRAELEKIVAIYDAKQGEYDDLFHILLRESHDSGIGGPAVELLELACDDDRCAHMARSMLGSPYIKDKDWVQAVFDRAVGLPLTWRDALAELARAPSIEKWDEVMRFAPPEREYHWARDAIARLDELGVDGDWLFKFATRLGTIPDAYRLCEEGWVSPEVVAARGEGSPIQGSWLALAAISAHARGDDLGCVRYVRAARACEECPEIRDIWLERLRDSASESLLGLLDAA